MPPLGMAASLGLGTPRAATSSGVPGGGASYDEDAQTYFDALVVEGATPSDARKLAISNYFEALKDASNFTDVKALYIPIWGSAAPNSLNAVNPGTYDLTWIDTVTHADGYIYGDGLTGMATAGLQSYDSTGTKFWGRNDQSFGGNVVDYNSSGKSVLCGMKYQHTIFPYYGATTSSSAVSDYAGWLTFTDNDHEGLYVVNSIPLDPGKNTAGEVFHEGTSEVTGQFVGAGSASNRVDWGLLAYNFITGPSYHSTFHVNFAFAGTTLTSASDFNTDTATLLAAI